MSILPENSLYGGDGEGVREGVKVPRGYLVESLVRGRATENGSLLSRQVFQSPRIFFFFVSGFDIGCLLHIRLQLGG